MRANTQPSPGIQSSCEQTWRDERDLRGYSADLDDLFSISDTLSEHTHIPFRLIG